MMDPRMPSKTYLKLGAIVFLLCISQLLPLSASVVEDGPKSFTKTTTFTESLLTDDDQPVFQKMLRGDLDLILQMVKLTTINEYTIAPGDTVTKIAKDNGLMIETILSYNKIQSPRLMKPKGVLKLPSIYGVLVSLSAPESIDVLADSYGAAPNLIRLANWSSVKSNLVSGDVFIPGARMDPVELRKLLGEYFLWPTKGGWISSRFGSRNDPISGIRTSHTGVDIANYYGAPVLAAGSGRVTFAGYNRILGNHIKVDQGQGFVAVYGHLSSILVKVRQKVSAGQLIGKVGSSGYSTGPHLHFSAYRWGKLLNPMALFG